MKNNKKKQVKNQGPMDPRLQEVEFEGRVFEDHFILDAYKHFGTLTPKQGRKVKDKFWKDQYKEGYDITGLVAGDEFPVGDNVIYCTSCSAEKTDALLGTPIEIYASKITQSFMKTMEELKMPYAILSGEKGFIKHDEIIETYDSGSTTLIKYEEEYKMDAINLANQLKENGWDTVVFCYGSPLRAESFQRPLAYARDMFPELNLKLYYTTSAKNITTK